MSRGTLNGAVFNWVTWNSSRPPLAAPDSAAWAQIWTCPADAFQYECPGDSFTFTPAADHYLLEI